MANTPLEYWEQTKIEEEEKLLAHFKIVDSTSTVYEKNSESLICQEYNMRKEKK